MISLFSFLPYLPVVGTIAKMNAAQARERPGGNSPEPPNSNFSGLNIAGIVCGGLLFVLAVIGMLSGIRR